MESVIKALTQLNQNQMETLQISIFFPCDFPGFFFFNQFPLPPLLQVSPSIFPFPQIQPLSVSPQKRAGLPGTLPKHAITSYCLTRHVKAEQDNPFGGKVPTSRQESQRHPRLPLLGIS